MLFLPLLLSVLNCRESWPNTFKFFGMVSTRTSRSFVGIIPNSTPIQKLSHVIFLAPFLKSISRFSVITTSQPKGIVNVQTVLTPLIFIPYRIVKHLFGDGASFSRGRKGGAVIIYRGIFYAKMLSGGMASPRVLPLLEYCILARFSRYELAKWTLTTKGQKLFIHRS